MDNFWKVKQAPLKEAPMLGLVGMGGGAASLMWRAAGVNYEQGNIWGMGHNPGRWIDSQPTSTKRSSPVLISGSPSTYGTWIYTYKGGEGNGAMLGINADKQLYIWGNNQNGEWGNNNTNPDGQSTSNTFPNGYTVPGSWMSASNDSGATFGIKEDGTLWSWGWNDQGRLGLNQSTPTKISSPTQIPGTNWQAVKAQGYNGDSVVMATKTDGTLWIWGRNHQGQLGQNDRTQRSSPVQVPGTNWGTSDTSIDIFNNRAFCCSGGKSSFCIKQDNTLWAWGGSPSGALGLNSNTHRSSPTQIPGTWGSINGLSTNGGNGVFTAGIRQNGDMYMWGYNFYGILGQNNRTHYSSPRQIPGTWKIDGCAGGGSKAAMLAVKANGTFWSWGYAYMGGLGLNFGDYPAIYCLSSPVQMGNDSDWILGGGDGEYKGYALGGKTRT